jgi:hypothetical protein
MNLPYRAGTDRDNFTVIAPFSSNPSGRYGLSYVNVHDGKVHHPGQPSKEDLMRQNRQTYGAVVRRSRSLSFGD